jgi:hypothetical protein
MKGLADMALRAGDRSLLAAGAAGLLLCGALATNHPARSLVAYLAGWLFFLGLSLGSLALLMMHHLTGGRWGGPLHRYFVAALAPMPLLALLFVPVLLGLASLFPWAGEASTTIHTHSFRSEYLTGGAFTTRAGVALLTWNLLRVLLRRRAHDPSRLGSLSAIGLIAYGVTMTWAAVDWIGSLQPEWASTALGLIVMTGQGLSAFAFATLCATRSRRSRPFLSAERCGDLGNLLLSFLMTWMYLEFVQFLIIWAEDLPRETSCICLVCRAHGEPWRLLSFWASSRCRSAFCSSGG